jgi:uridine monophosphate synthetase
MNSYVKEHLVKEGLLLISDNPEEYTLKSGKKTNIYINLKDLVKHPYLLSAISIEMNDLIKSSFTKDIKSVFNNISLCGVPYGAIPLASNLSIIMNLPQILVRKEGAKGYGTKKMVEGLIPGNSVIIIEDVVTTGTSIKETIKLLLDEGINVIAAYSIVHRGNKNMTKIIVEHDNEVFKNAFIPYYYLYHIDEIIEQQKTSYYDYISEKITEKGTNIILAYDKLSTNTFIDLSIMINDIHKHIIGLKIHPEILQLTYDELVDIHSICNTFGLFLWIDRKFNDIGSSVMNQVNYYSDCCDAISIAPTGGLQHRLFTVDELSHINKFILLEMSSSNNTFDLNVRNKILQQYLQEVEHNPQTDIQSAIICQDEKLIEWLTSKKIVSIRPGINIGTKNDKLNQKYTHPNTIKHHATMYVVGRGIIKSNNPIEAVKIYKKLLLPL